MRVFSPHLKGFVRIPTSAEFFCYIKFGDHATNLPSTVRFASNGVFKESMQYRYDSMGNIVEIFENGRSTCKYEYDALGRLTREDNVAFGKTTTWAYDNNGNIIAKYEYAITTKPTNELYLLNCKTFTYCYDDNSDQLLSITKDDGSTVTTELFVYDQIGNPTTYCGKAATWVYGRQLTAYDGNTFTYDARGRRTAKNGITFTYDSNGNLIKQSNGLEFLYDHTGVFAVNLGTQTYFYRKDVQSNIVELLDSNGATVVKYKYDAWGNCQTTVVDSTANTIAELNPFRYRSYYFDTETNLYFLKTRYYDPEIGRFMTIDDISYLDPESINGLNLYTYCGNNPVMGYDPNGTWDMPKWLAWTISGIAIVGGLILCATGVGGILGGVLIGAGAGSLINGYVSEANGGSFTAGYIGGAVSGALCGVGAGLGGLAFSAAANAANLASLGYLGLGTLASFAGGFAGNLASTVYTNWHNSGFRKIDINWRETFKMSAIMGALNIFAGMGSGMSSIVGEMGKVATDMSSKLASQILAGSIAGGTEFFYDLISYLISKLVSEF